VTDLLLTHIGGPTMLIQVGGWRLLTDPTFDPPGQKYNFGWGTSSVKLAGPAVPASDLGPIDAVLLTHDHHDDNLDPAGRALLPAAGAVVTTVSGSKRLGGDTRGLEPWATTVLEAAGRPSIGVTATPCRHGPPLSRPVAGDVVGFALGWEGQEHGVLWISGDTVLYDGVRQVANRLQVDVALLHLGGVQFPVTGPVRYTMTAKDAVELSGLVRARTIIPIHYEGWKHFQQGREAIERELERAPQDIRERIRWLPLALKWGSPRLRSPCAIAKASLATPTKEGVPASPGRPSLRPAKQGVTVLQEGRSIDEGADLLGEVCAFFGHHAVYELRRGQVEQAVLQVRVVRVHRGELDHLARDDRRDALNRGGLRQCVRAGFVRDRPAAEDRVGSDEEERGPLELLGRPIVLDELDLKPRFA
jgi:L-ascorbate metabolism protein UlaG (beta-lactamase superfamily)